MARISHRPYLDRLSMPWGREVTNLLEEHARLIEMLRRALVATSRKGTSTRQQVQRQELDGAPGSLSSLVDVDMSGAQEGYVLKWNATLGRAEWRAP